MLLLWGYSSSKIEHAARNVAFSYSLAGTRSSIDNIQFLNVSKRRPQKTRFSFVVSVLSPLTVVFFTDSSRSAQLSVHKMSERCVSMGVPPPWPAVSSMQSTIMDRSNLYLLEFVAIVCSLNSQLAAISFSLYCI